MWKSLIFVNYIDQIIGTETEVLNKNLAWYAKVLRIGVQCGKCMYINQIHEFTTNEL